MIIISKMKKCLILIFCINIIFLQNVNASNNMKSDDFENSSELLEAINAYEKLIQKYPNKKELHYNLGNINYLYGDFESSIENYTNALGGQNNKEKAYALYNLGNIFYEKEAFEESIDLYKAALKLSPYDKDAQHNLELSKIMLQKQRQQKKQNNDQKNKDDSQENNDENNEEQNNEEQNNDESDEAKNNVNNDKKEDQGEKSNALKNNKSQSENDREESMSEGKEKNVEDEMSSDSMKTSNEDIEKKIGKQEAEAILNALKADESNMKVKKYKSIGRLKVEKDW